MKIEYWPEYDALYVRLKPTPEATGAEVAPGIVFHYSEGDSREVVSIEIDSRASELVDLDELRIEGLSVKSEAPNEATR